MKKLFTEAELLYLGFQELSPGDLDEEGYYTLWSFDINNLNISITAEYSNEGKFLKDYVEINGDKFPFMTKESVINLIKILRDGKAKD